MNDAKLVRQEYELESTDVATIFNLKKRRIDIFGQVDRQLVLDLVNIIEELKSKPTKKNEWITVVVNSVGGLAMQGLAAYDILVHSGFKIRTIVLGEAASSGLAIAMAGQKRLMYSNAILHFHATAMTFNKPKDTIEQSEEIIQRKQIRKIDELFQKIFLANSNLTKRVLKKLELNERCLNAQEALKAGLIHEIIRDKFDL